jgi:hypothetical protein
VALFSMPRLWWNSGTTWWGGEAGGAS